MPVQTIYALGESQITVSGGGQLSGVSQGDGSHLDGLTITLNSNAWEGILVDDDDTSFADNDSGQRLEGAQTFDGTSYADNLRVEAEFSLVVQDSFGNQYTLYAFNINEPGASNSYGTVEGLAFLESSVGGSVFPPIGEPLLVLSSSEGPTNPYATLATPACFTPGTLILTPGGLRDVADLAVGDEVMTLDHGHQVIRWIGRTTLTGEDLRKNPRFRPVTIAPDSFGPGMPFEPLRVSPQHRIFVSGWRAQLFFGQEELLVTAAKLCNGTTVTRCQPSEDVTYIHLLCDRHEILWSNGLPSESYFPAAEEDTSMAAELRRLFPQKFGQLTEHLTARPCISDKRAIALSA